RSSRRSATVTSSQPEASRAASIAASSAYLPVPRKSRDRSSTPAITNRSTAATVCIRLSLDERCDPLSPGGEQSIWPILTAASARRVRERGVNLQDPLPQTGVVY